MRLLIFRHVLHDFAEIVVELLATVLRCNLVHWLEWTLESNLPQKQSNTEGYVWVVPNKEKCFIQSIYLHPKLHPNASTFFTVMAGFLAVGPSVAFIKLQQGSSVKLHSLSCIVLHRDRAPSLLKRIPQKVPEVLPTPHQSQSPKEKNSSDLQIFFVNKLLKPTVA